MPGQESSRFDVEAARHDHRTGIPEPQRSEIATAFVALTGAEPGDVLLELGAGTGQLGVGFAALGLRYIGMDSSLAMLDQFERLHARAATGVELVHADVNRRWPIERARFVFSSRAAHLFDAEHVMAELGRVARLPGAALVLGRVERPADGMRSVLRREMRERLREAGFSPNDGNRRQRALLETLIERGAHCLGPVRTSAWTASISAGRVLDDWRRKAGLGGLTLPADIRDDVLAAIERFAVARYGSLERMESSDEVYVLDGAVVEHAALEARMNTR